jgi:hypothetical protein
LVATVVPILIEAGHVRSCDFQMTSGQIPICRVSMGSPRESFLPVTSSNILLIPSYQQ